MLGHLPHPSPPAGLCALPRDRVNRLIVFAFAHLLLPTNAAATPATSAPAATAADPHKDPYLRVTPSEVGRQAVDLRLIEEEEERAHAIAVLVRAVEVGVGGPSLDDHLQATVGLLAQLIERTVWIESVGHAWAQAGSRPSF